MENWEGRQGRRKGWTYRREMAVEVEKCRGNAME